MPCCRGKVATDAYNVSSITAKQHPQRNVSPNCRMCAAGQCRKRAAVQQALAACLLCLQEAGASDSDEEDDFIYNPLKLPLGWDGKPIPYWLYKLHGLNQEFTCEICGSQKYWGRRAFERHFREQRHQHGMRALGIPNTKNFYEVTQIEDAQRLWKNIQVSFQPSQWQAPSPTCMSSHASAAECPFCHHCACLAAT